MVIMQKATIAPAICNTDLIAARRLFRAYAGNIGLDLGFQDFTGELAKLPGPYAQPDGCILLARIADRPVGTVGLRPLSPGYCEMKRLYVEPAWRGRALGRALITEILAEGHRRKYRAMRMDTVSTVMSDAIALYHELGFSSIPAYRNYGPKAPANLMFLEYRYR